MISKFVKRPFLYSMLAILVTTAVGCAGLTKNKDVASDTKVPKLSSVPSPKADSSVDDLTKWSGNWENGSSDVAEKGGASASMLINNVNNKQFEFSIEASFISTIVNEKGEKILNEHTGDIEGTAFFTSSNEAYYTEKDYPDYKMIFKIINDNTIRISEINTKTGKDYGSSPLAGVNVRYQGDYVLK